MSFVPSTPPTWLYKKVTVPNLSDIQHELLQVSKFIIKDINNLVPDFHYIPRSDIETMVPKTKEYLDNLGLLSRWRYLALITGNAGESLELHVDALDWTTRAYGLNIPVMNCENSFTVFYNSEPVRPIFEADDVRSSAYLCKEDTAVELDKVEASNTCWVNVSIPHRPIVKHQLPRILASFRFSPEVHDFLIDI